MLTTLRIKNLALVEDLVLELPPGFVAITGETGAGKSIILGALKLLLGERADRSLIRAGCEHCAVEAALDAGALGPRVPEFLQQHGLEPCEGGQLLLRRSFTAAGANRQFINGSPVSLSVLAALGEWLVDMHGPHDHQSLLQPARQLDILDAFGKLEKKREIFAALLGRRARLEQEKAGLIVDERTYRQRLDLLRHQTREIAEARLQPDEEQTVEAEYHRASNAARLAELGGQALELLGESDASLQSQAGSLGRLLQELRRLDPSTGGWAEAQAQLGAVLGELQMSLRHYTERLELDPDRLRQLEERLDLLQSLKRKYGRDLAEVIEFGRRAARELESLENRGTELERLDRELAALDQELRAAGRDLSAQRRRVAPELGKLVSRQLAELGFKASRLDAQIETDPALETQPGAAPAAGFDRCEFLFAPNPGEPARPLRAIASSGEMARVMLALKTVLAVEDQVPVLIFDEVDANVGGETANAVGEKMARIARRRQVLCITHLAPVAAAAGAHFAVTKEAKDGRTISRIERVDKTARLAELARMLGGGAAAQQHARALLRQPRAAGRPEN